MDTKMYCLILVGLSLGIIHYVSSMPTAGEIANESVYNSEAANAGKGDSLWKTITNICRKGYETCKSGLSKGKKKGTEWAKKGVDWVRKNILRKKPKQPEENKNGNSEADGKDSSGSSSLNEETSMIVNKHMANSGSTSTAQFMRNPSANSHWRSQYGSATGIEQPESQHGSGQPGQGQDVKKHSCGKAIPTAEFIANAKPGMIIKSDIKQLTKMPVGEKEYMVVSQTEFDDYMNGKVTPCKLARKYNAESKHIDYLKSVGGDTYYKKPDGT